MEAHGPEIWIQGDLQDPWLRSLVERLAESASVRVIPPSEQIPSQPQGAFSPRVVVVHQSRLSPADVSRLHAWRLEWGPGAQITTILCVGPLARFAEVELLVSEFDVTVTETTLEASVLRRIRSGGNRSTPQVGIRRDSISVAVDSPDPELRDLLSEICDNVGFHVVEPRAVDAAVASGSPCPGRNQKLVTLWDVPVLEPAWSQWLARKSRRGPIVALLGFGDRELASLAEAHGADSCLELPFDNDDLAFAIEEAVVSRRKIPPPRLWRNTPARRSPAPSIPTQEQ
jgi:hypothetical protein